MPNTITSPLMSLPIPIPSVDPGPDYAYNLNASLALIDAHDHSPGKGNPVTPAGLSINSDLSMISNNLIQARSLRFASQPSVINGASDVGCLYDVNGDLYFNDGSANQIRITQSGGIAGTPGSISNLVSPASASYVAVDTAFVWQSAANMAALLDCGSIKLRNATVSSKACTLNPPAAMGIDISQTLPTIPGSATSIMQMDTSGNMSASLNVDNSTLQISGNVMSVKGSLTQSMKGPMTVGNPASVGNVARSSSLTSTSFGANTSVTITTIGRPVKLGLIGENNNLSYISVSANPGTIEFDVVLTRGDIPSTPISKERVGISVGSGLANAARYNASAFNFIDFPAAGTYTYTVTFSFSTGNFPTIAIEKVQLIAYEL